MTIKEAIIKSLEDLKAPSSSEDIYEHIIKNNYYEFKRGKTPKNTISAQLGSFIRQGDERVKRVKDSRSYLYYLSKFENDIEIDDVDNDNENTQSTYKERDLHILLSSYLNNKNIYSKTILHEQSKNSEHQKWIHPDMVGIEFLDLKSNINRAFMRVVQKSDIFKISSYEIKREINTDYELKKSYFQALSNSNWANYGYLVAFEINDNLKNEIQRLNESFGIGIIELNPNPYESRVLFQARYKELDFKTIDKLCRVNHIFEEFIELIERLLTIDERNYQSVVNELSSFCDDYFINDSEIVEYCKSHSIPIKN